MTDMEDLFFVLAIGSLIAAPFSAGITVWTAVAFFIISALFARN